MAVIHRFSGLTGVVLFFSFLIALTYFTLFKFVQASGGNVAVNCLILWLVTISSAPHWLARPHIFTLTLTVAWYFILHIHQYKNKNYLYLLPPIMLFWVNLHGAFILGLILLAIYLCGNVGQMFFSPAADKTLIKQKVRALSYTCLLCLLFSVANPQGPYALLYPFDTVSQQWLVNNVIEYRPPNFHDLLAFKYLLLFTIGILAVSRAKIQLIELALVLLFTYMALHSVRHIPLFAIAVAPILARHTDVMLQKTDKKFISLFKVRAANLASLDANLRSHVWPGMAVFLVCLLASVGMIRFSFEKTTAPVGAVNFLKRENIRRNMFSTDQYGDYVIYAASPQYKVFIDDRSDMYDQDKLNEYLQVVGLRTGWKMVMAKYGVNFILCQAGSPLSLRLAETDDWRVVYADQTANVFVKNVAENRSLIEKYPNVKFVLQDKSRSS